MEAASLKIKKQIQKGKLKKTMKNVICRPDPSSWPLATEDNNRTLTEELNKLKVDIPDLKKPHWSELSQIPKEQRPKPPPIPKVEGLIFGLTECKKAIEIKQCIGILIDADVNPKTIIQPLIDICLDKSIPVLCLKDLRMNTDSYFGIATSVLGVKENSLPDLEKKFLEISKFDRAPPTVTEDHEVKDETPATPGTPKPDVEMKVTPNLDQDEIDEPEEKIQPRDILWNPYVYRILKTRRAFRPDIQAKLRAKKEEEEFIKISNEPPATISKPFVKMNVKKISSNPNRRKVTKGNPKE